ncbi:TPA: hypothetical protein DIV48_01120 [Candidatus Kaiserbacteria bacterium]|nr:MAG: hypothetical protein UY93_C0002G0017 [Parcubacteria group bacterium GW2011_GWA1_56_13]KKW46304.1 MAG: hypothetical protein UY97_C0007G0015 [Parcubacteria group bacterium GW2011_GWB1_57_6]HCR52232.1 hypothetical protein [Candidatus Kaiserbacteria bacterium]
MSTPTFLLLIRYGVAGMTGALIQTSTLYIWVDVFHFEDWYLVGAVVGFHLALLATFALQKYWTFRDRAYAGIRRQFFFYTIIALASLGLNILFLHTSKLFLERLGFDFFHGWYLLAQVGSIAIVAATSFVANYSLTFRRPV